MSVRVDLDWGTINNELVGPTGMVQRNMRTIIRAIRLYARWETPKSSGHMAMSWKSDKVPKVFGSRLTWRISNTADYAAARISGVRPTTAPSSNPMMVGATQKYGNPLLGPHRGVTAAIYRDGYAGKPIFDLALESAWVTFRL